MRSRRAFANGAGDALDPARESEDCLSRDLLAHFESCLPSTVPDQRDPRILLVVLHSEPGFHAVSAVVDLMTIIINKI